MRTVLAGLMMVVACWGDWKDLEALKAGDRVGVVKMDQKRVEGRFESASEGAIVVDGVSVAKDQVARVYRRPGVNRLTRALIGAGAGVALGAILAETAGKRFENEGAGPEAAGWYAIGIGAGAGIGAASGGGYRTLYQRK